MIKIEKIYRSFSLEIWEFEPQLSLSAYQGETCRALEITLTDKGSVYPIPENHRAVFTALKPDGKVIFNPCLIENNKILYTLTPQSTALAGLLSCQIRLYGEDDALILSPRFSLLLRPSVYTDESILESENEVGALTALVSETQEALDEIRQSLSSGAFVPQFSIGSVETLPAGEMARVELTGTGEKPVLNFKLPQGEVGTAEELIPDAALSESSTRPVQNRVITQALSNFVEKEEFGNTLSNFVEKEEFGNTLSNFVEKEEFGNSLSNYVEKEEGKGLSENDFTDALREKLENLKGLASSAVTSSMIANSAVSRAKLAADALYSPFETLSANTTVGKSHVGKKLRMGDGTVDYVVNIVKDSSIPSGAELAIFRQWAKSNKIVFAGDTRVAIAGEISYLTAPSFTIAETFTTVALEKITSDGTYDYWHIIGNVEVVE